MSERSPQSESKWPPDGFVAIGDYAFSPNMAPSPQQLEDAETFVFTRPEFQDLSEEQRRRNVVRLAMAAGGINQSPHVKVGGESMGFTVLIGGMIVVTKGRLHEGSVICEFLSKDQLEEIDETS